MNQSYFKAFVAIIAFTAYQATAMETRSAKKRKISNNSKEMATTFKKPINKKKSPIKKRELPKTLKLPKYAKNEREPIFKLTAMEREIPLKKREFDISNILKEHSVLLFNAVKQDNSNKVSQQLKQIQKIKKRKEDFNAYINELVDDKGCGVLHFAQSADIIKSLLDAGANRLQQNQLGKTALHSIIQKFYLSECFGTIARILLPYISPDDRNEITELYKKKRKEEIKPIPDSTTLEKLTKNFLKSFDTVRNNAYNAAVAFVKIRDNTGSTAFDPVVKKFEGDKLAELSEAIWVSISNKMLTGINVKNDPLLKQYLSRGKLEEEKLGK